VIGGVLLAAGRGRRLGGPKARLVRDGRPVLDTLVEAYRAGGIAPIAVSWPRGAPTPRAPSGITWAPTDPDAPMSAALAGALAALEATLSPGGIVGVVVQPIDAVDTDAALVAALVEAARAAPTRPLQVMHRARVGHPVYAPRALWAALVPDPPGGLGALVAAAGPGQLAWPDPRVLTDVDTPDDARRAGVSLAGHAAEPDTSAREGPDDAGR
jgi:CTP:molybdopterin cytidylyltransferase MocA